APADVGAAGVARVGVRAPLVSGRLPEPADRVHELDLGVPGLAPRRARDHRPASARWLARGETLTACRRAAGSAAPGPGRSPASWGRGSRRRWNRSGRWLRSWRPTG